MGEFQKNEEGIVALKKRENSLVNTNWFSLPYQVFNENWEENQSAQLFQL